MLYVWANPFNEQPSSCIPMRLEHRVLRAREFLIIGAEKDGNINPRNVLEVPLKLQKSITKTWEPFWVENTLISSSCPRQRRKKRGKVFPRNENKKKTTFIVILARLSVLCSECMYEFHDALDEDFLSVSFCVTSQHVVRSCTELSIFAASTLCAEHRLFFLSPRYVLVRFFPCSFTPRRRPSEGFRS